MSSKPCFFSSSTMCSIIGRLAIGIIGLGWLEVSGRSRVPSPPAMITAFMLAASCLRRRRLSASGRARHRDVGDRRHTSRATSAGITATQARTSASWCQSSWACPTRNRGRAHMRPNVPALPAHWTSIRRPPAAATTIRNPIATRRLAAEGGDGHADAGPPPPRRWRWPPPRAAAGRRWGRAPLPTVETWLKWRAT